MKASELMIGDWVFCTYPSIKKPFRVEEIRTVGDNELKIIISDDLRLVFQERYIEPIPLTPEILEKNGFKYTDNHTLQGSDTYLLRYEQNGFDYTITYKLDDWFAVDSYDDRTYRIFEMETGRWHVHQLQHALKLCGINKEIVI